MGGYHYIELPVTNCVHFVQDCGSSSIESTVEAARRKGVRFAYWSYLDGGREATTIANPLAAALGLEHAPYGGLPWVPFLDDLITLAYRHDGLVIVIDRADLLITERREGMFDCVEAFLHQFHHWYDQKKPCHLCFQMVKDDHVTELFTREGRDKVPANSGRL